MKTKLLVVLLILCAIAAFLYFSGFGPYSSSAAVADLKAELESIHGPETEDMRFVIEPKTRIMTNWNLRNALGLDYEYACKVISKDGVIIYKGIDPMGAGEQYRRAYLELEE